MKYNKKLKRASLVNIITGYLMMVSFLILIILNRPAVVELTDLGEEDSNIDKSPVVAVEDDPVELRSITDTEVIDIDPEGREIVYVDRSFRRDHSIGIDHPRPGIIDNRLNGDSLVDFNRDIYVDTDRENRIINNIDDTVYNRAVTGRDHSDRVVVGRGHAGIRNTDANTVLDNDIDIGILDRRLADMDDVVHTMNDITVDMGDRKDIDEIGLGNLTIDTGDEAVIDESLINSSEFTGGDGVNAGNLYAYNYPSQGVGAGIGSTGVGAVAGMAGIGAGIGEAVLNGKSVPALGGIGTYRSVETVLPGTGTDTDSDGLDADAEAVLGTDPNSSDTDGDGFSDGAEIASYTNPLDSASNAASPGSSIAPAMGGVAGLVGGAGAGGAAGLVTGMVKTQLGIGPGTGKGCQSHGGSCNGHHDHEYDLPPDGALHIMMHVDGSGSILDTRKQLIVMKDTLLKAALLPYYNNDESLYNKRVTVVDGNGERTLQFFNDATKKDNVLAIVFQDEAQPSYHLPTFNRKPQDHYSKDLGQLKASLQGYPGVYRGIMFQVNRGKTFAKSFKEFVQSAFEGVGYLENENLGKYHRDNNRSHIKNKEGVVFSDEYHAKSEGDPQYYMDLILKASERVGLNLKSTGGGLTDGKYNRVD